MSGVFKQQIDPEALFSTEKAILIYAWKKAYWTMFFEKQLTI